MSGKRKKKYGKVLAKHGSGVVRQFHTGGLIIYGVGEHLQDMLAWYDDLAGRIIRVVDRDREKIGKKVPGLVCEVESPEVLKGLPAGTWVVVSALRYYDEIVKELHELNPGLVCPNIDQAYTLMKQAEANGILVYGAGAHLADMLSWHPTLKDRIGRIFDKDKKKQGAQVFGTGKLVEGFDKLKHLPAGTQIAVSAIRYYREIVEELYALNPGLICQNIDDVYRRLPPFLTQETASAHRNAKDIVIGNVVLNFDTYSPDKDIYSDGDIENEMLQIVKDNREDEVLREDNRWPILYHFSKTRQNILSWYCFKNNARLLEIGTGCGAITGLFCERNLQVTGVESSKRRAKITAYRNKEYENLQLQVGNFIDMKFENKFDYITLIGVLEYSNMFLPERNDAFTEMLEHCRCLLEDDGKIFIAIENRLGMKYFAGAAEDHTGRRFDGIENYPEGDRVRTFSRSELQKLIMEAEFSQVEWFYPYPDYKLPRQIFSDEFLPTAELLTVGVEAYDNARVQLFDEMRAIKSLAGTEEFKIFSNSYLLIVSK